MFLDLLGKLFGRLKTAKSLATYSKSEAKLMERCIREIENKRKRALARAERRAAMQKKGRVISDWDPDDKHADDDYYNRKLEECYAKSRPISRAMGLP